MFEANIDKNMPAKKDYVGEMFGQLKVVECLEPSTGKNNGGFYRCECSCGTSINVYGYKKVPKKHLK